MTIKLTPRDDSLEVRTPYSAAFVQDLKAQIPAPERRWNPDRRVWLVASMRGRKVADLIKKHFGISLLAPHASRSEKETQLLKVLYIGRCKDRGTDERSAFGYCDGSWSVVLPEPVLKRWFWAVDAPGEKPTLYATLGVGRDATPRQIKKAYRRMARQWHPDVCDEPDAREQFLSIKDAYDLLSDHGKRARYDAGLALEATLSQDSKPSAKMGYRAPLRCGWILAEGKEVVGRFVVARILQWEDIKDEHGRVMVASWPRGGDDFEVKWA